MQMRVKSPEKLVCIEVVDTVSKTYIMHTMKLDIKK